MESNKRVTQGNLVAVDRSNPPMPDESIKKMAEIRSLDQNDLQRQKIIYAGTTDRALLDAFRSLRTRLVQQSKGKNFVVLVSSAARRGGGSFVSLNLAAAFALDSSKTSLIVDCNILDPHLDSMLSIPPDYGLTDYLLKPDISMDDIIYSSGIPRLRIIPAGARSELGAELFSSGRMANLVRGLQERYEDRFIILDAPSIDANAEIRILSEHCDQSLLVVPYGRVTQAQILGGIEVLGVDKFSGVIFND
ncbi:MAG: CpsD/CapB family tyrosine-protein kinase [Pseudomonadota bacterium]